MTPLRARMLEEMRLRNLAPSTQRICVDCVARYARHFRRSPHASPSKPRISRRRPSTTDTTIRAQRRMHALVGELGATEALLSP